MATFNPRRDLFEQQVNSITDQQHRNWMCYISDDSSGSEFLEAMSEQVGADDRFVLVRHDTHVGFYRNFERALELASKGTHRYVALADQDDRWYPEKLTTLVDRLEGTGSDFAYSDRRTVDLVGRTLSTDRWVCPVDPSYRLTDLMLNNVVSGSASLFRSTILDLVLPFPDEYLTSYHDHWIAVVAYAMRDVEYIDRPLMDYVQHGDNVIGVASPRFSVDSILRPRQRTLSGAIGRCVDIRESELPMLRSMANLLKRRLGGSVRPQFDQELERLAALGSSLRSVGWLLARATRDPLGRGPTLGAEQRLLVGVVFGRTAARILQYLNTAKTTAHDRLDG
jgi:glycosyltransferase involved in cell wall biosynthesis